MQNGPFLSSFFPITVIFLFLLFILIFIFWFSLFS